MKGDSVVAPRQQRVLLVEDNVGDAFLVEERLLDDSKMPWIIERATNLEVALESLRGQEFDAVLLDLGLPDSQGLQTLEKLIHVAKHIPIVVLTGVSDDQQGEEALRIGAQDFLSKNRLSTDALSRSLRYAQQRSKLQLGLERAHLKIAQSERLVSAGVLAGGIAHELNNPLTSVLFNLEAVVEDLSVLRAVVGEEHRPALSDVESRLQGVVSDAHRMRKSINELHAFSCADSSSTSAFSVNALLESVLGLISGILEQKATVTTHLSELPIIEVNEGRFATVLLSMLLTAAEAIEESDPGSNSIRVSSKVEGAEIAIEVTHTGRAMGVSRADELLDVLSASERNVKSSSFGLSICHTIIAEMSGKLRFYDGVDGGTRISIRFPYEDIRRERPRRRDNTYSEPPLPAKSSVEVGDQRARGRMLVIDDERGIGAAIKRMFRKEHDVEVALSGEEGLALIDDDPRFDVIFCDLVMDGLNGVEVYERVQARKPELAARFSFISGGSRGSRLRELVEATGRPFLKKPMKPAKIRATVQSTIAQRQS